MILKSLPSSTAKESPTQKIPEAPLILGNPAAVHCNISKYRSNCEKTKKINFLNAQDQNVN